MGQNEADLPREEFLASLREDLTHLYDAEHLRRSPLAALLGVADRFDTAAALRRILSGAIDSLRPPDDTPPRARAWLAYEALSGCYIQQLGQRAVAEELGLSVRQLRRELRDALEQLVDELWRQREPTPAWQGVASRPSREELLWLKDLPPGEPTDLGQTTSEVFRLAGPLAAQRGVQLTSSVDEATPHVAVHPVALTQSLLSLLTVAVTRADAGGRVHVSARSAERTVIVLVQSTPSPVDSVPTTEDEISSLELVDDLAELCGGTLVVSPESSGAFSATLSYPALAQAPVLVIDDHADTLQLLQRYTIGTRYNLVTTRDPEQALSLAEKVSPTVIVLDVMMPQVDGWHVLGRLREHPSTRDVPIVVCTILAQEALALSLGASDFVRKPVTRQDFLAALDRQTARRERGPR